MELLKGGGGWRRRKRPVLSSGVAAKEVMCDPPGCRFYLMVACDSPGRPDPD